MGGFATVASPRDPESALRIVHYCQHALSGETGSANSARGWAQALAEAGHDLELVVDADQIALPDIEGVRTVAQPHMAKGRFRLPRRIGDALGGADLVVLHGGWVPANDLAGAYCRRNGIPYVITTHGAFFSEVLRRGTTSKKVWAALTERRLLESALGVHLLFADERSGLDELGIEVDVIEAPNGMTPPADAKWDGGSGGYLLWLGRFDPVHKGLSLLVDAVALLPADQRPQIRLHGPDWRGHKDELREQIADRGVTDHVHVEDPIYGDGKWDLLCQARGFVLPSRWEASPMAAAEAASLGVPVLMTPFPMSRFMAEHGGARVVERTPEALAEGLRWLDSPEAATVGARGAVVAREQLDWSVVAASWLAQVEERLTKR